MKGLSDVAPRAKDALLAAYLDHRSALVRSFTVRTGSPQRAEDIVQDIYLRLQGLTDEAAGDIRNPIAFLYGIGGNLMVDEARQTRRSATRDQAWSDVSGLVVDGISVADLPSPEDTAWARLKLVQVAKALEDMPPKARMAFRLHRIDGLTHTQTAARMGVSQSSVEKYLSTVLAGLLQKVGWP